MYGIYAYIDPLNHSNAGLYVPYMDGFGYTNITTNISMHQRRPPDVMDDQHQSMINPTKHTNGPQNRRKHGRRLKENSNFAHSIQRPI